MGATALHTAALDSMPGNYVHDTAALDSGIMFLFVMAIVKYDDNVCLLLLIMMMVIFISDDDGGGDNDDSGDNDDGNDDDMMMI